MVEVNTKVGRVAPDPSRLFFGVLSGLVGPQEVDEGLREVQRATAAGSLEIGQQDALPAVA